MMLKKAIAVILTVSALLFCLSSCGEVKGSEAAFIIPIDKDPEYLDPQIISDPGAKNIIANCFEGLVTLADDGSIAPGCAESWQISADGLTYTFKLRDKLKWRVSTYAGAVIDPDYKDTYDSSITSEDFLFGLRRALLPETKSPGAPALFSIQNAKEVYRGQMNPDRLGISAPDKDTLIITLEHRDPDFLYTLLEPACMPCDEVFFEATAGRYGLSTKYLLYNGPFYINNWTDDTSVTARKNEAYYDKDSVMPRSLYFSINNEQDTRLDKLKDKIYTVAPLTKDQAQTLSSSKKYTVTESDSAVLSLIFNSKDETLKNPSIRQALVSCFDYEALTEIYGTRDARGVLPQSSVSGGKSYRSAAKAILPGSVSDPKALLEKGLKELKKSDIELSILCSKENEAPVRRLMQSWQAIFGVKFNVFVEAVQEGELTARVKSLNYQIALFPVSYGGNTAFSGLLRFTSGGAGNIIGLGTEKYDTLVENIKSADGAAATITAAEKAESYLVKGALILPLYQQKTYYGTRSSVSNLRYNLTGDIVYFKYALSQ
ncbi:MAG: peptide ABC transporter substrate-binding protein [Oscillospiraceae bacterium]|nr:peptide ABC transporter substrate-binding protein [Oscillospiraceae bacterium]